MDFKPCAHNKSEFSKCVAFTNKPPHLYDTISKIRYEKKHASFICPSSEFAW